MVKGTKLILMLVIAGGLILAVTSCNSSDKAAGEMDETAFAQEALANYVNFALNEENAAKFGFKDLREAQTATLGDPLRVYTIALDSLKEYSSETAVRSLFSESSKLYYPVTINNEVRTKLEIVNIKGEWVAGEFGGTDAVKIVEDTRVRTPELLAARDVTRYRSPILVEIPILHVSLIYVETPDQGFFIPALQQPGRYGLENGTLYPAERVLSVLSEVAQGIKGDTLD